MGRVYFPTYSLNRFGVRDTDQRATLAGPADKFYQEPSPRAAMNPTAPMLGAIATIPSRYVSPIVYWNGRDPYSPPIPVVKPSTPPPLPPVTSLPVAQKPLPPTPAPISSSGGGGSISAPAAPPAVSTQQTPTPTVNVTPQTAPTGAVLISSGGGVATPATATISVTAAPASSSGGLVDGVAKWLGASTSLFGYSVPNALIAGVVVLGFAWLSSSSGKKR